LIQLSEEDNLKKTQFSGVKLDEDEWETFKNLKEMVFEEGCCFKKRSADAFLIGVCRAYFKNVFSKSLTNEARNIFYISPVDSGKKTTTLVDKEDFWNYFRLIAYATKIKEAGKNKESSKWKDSHNVIIRGTECTKISEEFFKGGWSLPLDGNFENLMNSDFPDDEICEDLGFMNQQVRYLEEENDDEL